MKEVSGTLLYSCFHILDPGSAESLHFSFVVLLIVVLSVVMFLLSFHSVHKSTN